MPNPFATVESDVIAAVSEWEPLAALEPAPLVKTFSRFNEISEWHAKHGARPTIWIDAMSSPPKPYYSPGTVKIDMTFQFYVMQTGLDMRKLRGIQYEVFRALLRLSQWQKADGSPLDAPTPWVYHKIDAPTKMDISKPEAGPIQDLISILEAVVQITCNHDDVFSDDPPADTTDPAVTILGPTSDPTYAADDNIVTLTGVATDNVAVASVTWSNSAGGSGTATGTDSWVIPDISLSLGENIITVTAHDSSGNTSNATLTVTYAPDLSAPVIQAVDYWPASAIVKLTFDKKIAVLDPTDIFDGTTFTLCSTAFNGTEGVSMMNLEGNYVVTIVLTSPPYPNCNKSGKAFYDNTEEYIVGVNGTPAASFNEFVITQHGS